MHFFLVSALLLLAAQLPSASFALGPGAVPDSSPCPIPASQYRPDTTVIAISATNDIYKRLAITTKNHVTLEIQNDIDDVFWIFNSSFSNTTLISKCGVGYTLTGQNATIPVLINIVSDFFIHALKINIDYDYTMNVNSTGYFVPTCPYPNLHSYAQGSANLIYQYSSATICPSLVAIGVKRIHIIGSSFYGAVVLSNTTETIVDGNLMTNNGLRVRSYQTPALHITNNGEITNLTYSSVIIRNNLINDTQIGIFLGRIGTGSAMGVQITNNNFSSFYTSSVHFGAGMQNLADSVSNYMAYNYIYRPANYPTDGDSGAVYMDTHWFGPNNTIEYNYLNVNGSSSYCIYIDYVTSGTRFTNNICDGPQLTYKLNTGRNNIVDDLLVIWSDKTWLMSCQNANINNCNLGNLGNILWRPYRFISSAWKKIAPWAETFCTDKYINGIRCNINDTMDAYHGNCSGLPLNNVVRIASVSSRRKLSIETRKLPLSRAGTTGIICAKAPNVDRLNTFNQTEYAAAQIYRDANKMARVNASSQLAKDYPNLVNFPYSQIGIKMIITSDFIGILPPSPDVVSQNDTAANVGPSIVVGTSTIVLISIVSISVVSAAGAALWYLRKRAIRSNMGFAEQL